MREYHRPLELVDRPVPEPTRPTDVLVRIGGAGVCATDLHAIEGLMEPAGVTLPRVLGHENAGWVEEVGAGVSTVAKGDAVLVYPPYSCGLCVACRRGNDMHCDRHQFTGLSVDGGFADYVVVAERSLLRLPAGVEPAEVAPHADAGLTAYHAVRRLAHLAVPGSTAVVIGVGGVGHIALQLLRALGSSTVIAVDTDERRRRLAAELGRRLGASTARLRSPLCATSPTAAAPTSSSTSSAPTRPTPTPMRCSRAAAPISVIGYGGTISIPSPALVVGEHAVVGNLVGTWIDLWELLQLHGGGEGRPQDGDASARLRQRGAGEAARRRGHRPRRARARLSARELRPQPWRPGAEYPGAMLNAVPAVATLSGLVTGFLPVVQIARMLRGRTAAGVSLVYVLGGLLNAMVFGLYGIALANPVMILANTVWVVTGSAMFGVAAFYRRSERAARPRPAVRRAREKPEPVAPEADTLILRPQTAVAGV